MAARAVRDRSRRPRFLAGRSLCRQGFSVGSNGLNGFGPLAAGAWGRGNYAVYGDVEVHGARKDWTIGAAGRTERFEDFGGTVNGKLSGRYPLSGVVALRGSLSTGFRAPTPGQQNAFNVSTVFDFTRGDLFNIGTIPSTSEIAALRGGRALAPERSVNYSAGAVVGGGSFTLTADYFRIDLSDPPDLTRTFTLTPMNRTGCSRTASRPPAICRTSDSSPTTWRPGRRGST